MATRYITRELLDQVGRKRLAELNSQPRLRVLDQEVVGITRFEVTRVDPTSRDATTLTVLLNEHGDNLRVTVPTYIAENLPEVPDEDLEPA